LSSLISISARYVALGRFSLQSPSAGVFSPGMAAKN
jgi:hypothetical protein